jgi:hypothetical protein
MKIELITRDDLLELQSKVDKLLTLVEHFGSDGSNEIYTTQQLAEKLSVSTKTIHTWREQKLIQFSQISNKIYYTEKSVTDFLLNHSIKRRYTN